MSHSWYLSPFRCAIAVTESLVQPIEELRSWLQSKSSQFLITLRRNVVFDLTNRGDKEVITSFQELTNLKCTNTCIPNLLTSRILHYDFSSISTNCRSIGRWCRIPSSSLTPFCILSLLDLDLKSFTKISNCWLFQTGPSQAHGFLPYLMAPSRRGVFDPMDASFFRLHNVS